jgi:hypothetical protein
VTGAVQVSDIWRYRLKLGLFLAFGLFLVFCAVYTTMKIAQSLGVNDTWTAILAALVGSITLLFIDRDF